MRSRRPALALGAVLTGPPAFLLAGLIDLACVLPPVLRQAWCSRRAR